MPVFKTKYRFENYFAFFLPFLLWIFLFRDFISGQITIGFDNNAHYGILKFYFNNLLNGVFPLWDPFKDLGKPWIFVAIAGIFNPLTGIIPVLYFLGVNYYDAYIIYVVSYYFAGLIGFYFLSKFLLKDKWMAYAAYVFLIFSGVGTAVFNQIWMLLIFVPSVWFFYFFVRFVRLPKAGDLFGMASCAILSLSSYYPFYFISLCLIVVLTSLIVYFPVLGSFLIRLKIFFRNNIVPSVFSLLIICIALIPAFLLRTLDSSGQIVSPARHCNFQPLETCVQALDSRLDMSYPETVNGSLAWRVSLRNFFSNLDKASYAQDGFFYLPVFCYLLLLVSVFTVFDRQMILLVITGFLVFLISLGDATPLHRILYEHINYFRYFRNLFFFMVFLMPIGILLAVKQLKTMIDTSYDPSKQKIPVPASIFITHGIFFLFLLWQGNIIPSSYTTVLGSLLFFVLFFGKYQGKKEFSFFIPGIFLLIALQPVEVFSAYSRHASSFQCALPSRHVTPQFSFLRPRQDIKTECLIYKFDSPKSEFLYDMLMQDSSGAVQAAPDLLRHVLSLFVAMDHDIFSDYIRNKLIVYDTTAPADDSAENIKRFEEAFKTRKNLAFVFPTAADGIHPAADVPVAGGVQGPQIIFGETDRLKVMHFDVNSLKLSTGFDSKRFLVYNDAFNGYWKVFVNGKEEKIYRANFAFKGIWLPAGPNTVYFKYSPPGGQGIYIFVIAAVWLFFLYTLARLYSERERHA